MSEEGATLERVPREASAGRAGTALRSSQEMRVPTASRAQSPRCKVITTTLETESVGVRVLSESTSPCKPPLTQPLECPRQKLTPCPHRLCLGKGADIWAYILQHVHSQSSVKKIRGNLLWYGHQDSPEVSRKLELEAAVARLRTEIQELDQSLELIEQEAEAQDLAVEQMLQSTRDTQYRALLLRAQTGNLRRQKHGLRVPTQQLQNQLR
ncbi:HAUS augmin-like complex subunit 5 [Marmota marmota marmota]|uniref:HAUS augmin-like complex subunit 5 n=1 Tax=Marmota marmota marmota TaxID=9994 RepID=UPI0020934788|nr:HAUS augmin-like complex subunit 5 [Marmota marmota marmota]